MTEAMSSIGSRSTANIQSCQRFQTTIISHPAHVSIIPRYKQKSDFLRKHSLRSFNTVRNIVVYSGVQPGSSPPDCFPGSWKMWLLGIALSAIFPFWANKWGPFKIFEKKIEAVVETVEDVAEFVEMVAEGVEKVAEDVSDNLPAGKLKDAIDRIEEVAETAAKDAHLVDDFIDKVEGLEKQVDTAIDQAIDQADEKIKK
ncbi:uncharacterized protein LOC123203030 [Mangifera indica]|uniref:uncharacterized protein LOC123203030 n=1 Tax=Mangifera indica TaxID=29780 RepID=UPI001CFA8AA6|nr:uncharacterized protein LOC123203030 [Mangifera indica]